MSPRINASRIQLSNYKRVAKKQQFYVFASSLLYLNIKFFDYFYCQIFAIFAEFSSCLPVIWSNGNLRNSRKTSERLEAFYGQSLARVASGFDRRVFHWMFPQFWFVILSRRQSIINQKNRSLTGICYQLNRMMSLTQLAIYLSSNHHEQLESQTADKHTVIRRERSFLKWINFFLRK